MKLLTLLFCTYLFAQTPADTPKWLAPSRKLIGETDDVRQKAIDQLEDIEGLDEELAEALGGPYRFQALDVIAALNREEWAETLLEKVALDEDGFYTLTLNALLTNDNKNTVAGRYMGLIQERSQRKLLSNGSLCAMLDMLGRLGYKMEEGVFSAIIKHDSFDVRQSAISYARMMALRYARPEFMKDVKKRFDDQPYQLRIQSLFAFAELGSEPIDKIMELCQGDKEEVVKKMCGELKKITPPKKNEEKKADDKK